MTAFGTSDASTEAESGLGLDTSIRDAGACRAITAEEGRAMMDEGGVTVVDVRPPERFAERHVPGAINVPCEEIGAGQSDVLGDPAGALIVYCRTGRRSKEAAGKLVAAGYQRVYDMGGIVDWPYETVAE